MSTERREGNEEKLNIPEIYRLVEQGAPTQTIVQQLYQDFYDGSSERVFLGLQELQLRNSEGIAALRYIAQGTEAGKNLTWEIVNHPEMDNNDLEKLLAIRKFENLVDVSMDDIDSFRKEVYRYGVAKGLIPAGSGTKKIDEIVRSQMNVNDNPHLSGEIETHVLNTHATFGSNEPTYLELLGPREILRLRSKDRPRFLLIGSLGDYSAKHLSSYAEKINRDTEVNVLDASKRIHGYERERRNYIQANAFYLPFQPGTLDHVYTNHILHAITDGKSAEADRVRITRLFNESAQALTTGGSLTMVEQPFGSYRENRNDISAMRLELKRYAKRAGLTLAGENYDQPTLVFHSEIGSTRINSNGFPHYPDALVAVGADSYVAVRYVKLK